MSAGIAPSGGQGLTGQVAGSVVLVTRDGRRPLTAVVGEALPGFPAAVSDRQDARVRTSLILRETSGAAIVVPVGDGHRAHRVAFHEPESGARVALNEITPPTTEFSRWSFSFVPAAAFAGAAMLDASEVKIETRQSPPEPNRVAADEDAAHAILLARSADLAVRKGAAAERFMHGF